MVKRFYLEEIIDRSHLSAFHQRFSKLTGIRFVPFNERGEAVIGDPQELLGRMDAIDFEQLARRDFMTRPDGSCIRVIKLTARDHLFGAVLLGPYLEANAKAQIAGVPRLTEDQVQAAVELIEQFFATQLEVSVERESIQRKEKILSVLEEASNIMNSSLEFNNLLEFLMDIAIDITGATCGAILLKKESKKYLEVAAARGKYPQEVKKIRVPLGKGVTGWVAKNREPLNVPNVLLEPRYIETPETIYSEMAVPLMVGDHLLGVIAVDSSEMNAFSKEDCATLITLASMVTKVVENSRLLSNSNRKLNELTRLYSISERLAEQPEDTELLDRVMADAAAALGCKGMALMRYDSDKEDVYSICNYSLPEELHGLRVPLGKGIHGWVAQHRQPLLVADAAQDVTVARHSFFDTFSRSVLCVPLLAGDRLVGVLSAHQKGDGQPFIEDDQRLLVAIGRLLTAHFENRRLIDDSRRKLDYLTTLYKVSSSVAGTLNVNRLFNMIMHQVQEVMDVENVSLMVHDSIKGQLSLDAAIGIPKKWVGTSTVKVGEGIAGWVAKHRQPLLIKDIAKDERFLNRPSRMDYKTRSALSVPIINNRSLLGVLNVNNKRSGGIFSEDDLNLLLGISGQISHAIGNAKLYERTEQQVAELSLIQELGKAINSSLDLDSVLNYFIDMTTRITESDKSSLMLFDEEQQNLYVQVHRGFDPNAPVKSFSFKLGEGIAGKSAEQRRPMRVINTLEDANYKQLPFSSSQTPLTLIAAPLLNRDKLIGVINCERELTK
ncbi:MAG TPA: GAF domain-containing protein, partial [Candidatus Ozemobacteraceae bacterium]|nr:GAF domain-containing protein [Candidatus Ozemobacteraceae bacterium]